ncbi:HNH endonuclease [Xenorhabdus bovienii]|uniref:HNH endonuclease n=1 Tax=Xenorhabdus bovienii TaxID=40576 RepID=UPI0023B2C14F|nr:HNH endonuclease [Xenorhabdus bovienii]MDE9535101.1 HNH endonuclease [Xenorhabdus bovienii]MDE9589243.1 HNH endonuclease [Xenorhabdus bovienii]
MRPIRRGDSPQPTDFDDYKNAKPELMSRLGSYCSYCERLINTNLAVEHIQPKGGSDGHSELVGRWDNFLLACINCNSIKKDKPVELDNVLLPDRDNTFYAYKYTEDGKVLVFEGLQPDVRQLAAKTLKLVGLDKDISHHADSNGELVAMDRVSQRMQAWVEAEEARGNLAANPDNIPLKEMVVRLAEKSGFFSVWMTVFDNDRDMKIRLISAFKGTEGSGCFNLENGSYITPSPNLDDLSYGGKI